MKKMAKRPYTVTVTIRLPRSSWTARSTWVISLSLEAMINNAIERTINCNAGWKISHGTEATVIELTLDDPVQSDLIGDVETAASNLTAAILKDIAIMQGGSNDQLSADLEVKFEAKARTETVS